jgi:rRNA maturation endonuclease Nob1
MAMNTTKPKMQCPNCGAEMNRHAEKIDYTAELKDPQSVDLMLGGVIEEFHTCPKCGSNASRRGS